MREYRISEYRGKFHIETKVDRYFCYWKTGERWVSTTIYGNPLQRISSHLWQEPFDNIEDARNCIADIKKGWKYYY